MPKIPQASLQQYVNHELPDVQVGFRKGRGTRDQIANTCQIIEKAREFQENIYFCFNDYAKAFDCVDYNSCGKFLRDGNTRPPYLPPEKSVCRSRSNNQNWTWNRLVPNRERSVYVKAVYCHPAYLTHKQSTSCKMPGWMKHKLESRFAGVQPPVDPGNSKVGTESASLEKYIFNHRYREIRNGQCSRKISGEKEAE